MSRLEDAVEEQDWERVEELWLEALDEDSIPVERLLELRRLIWKQGRKSLALTLLELLADALEARDDPDRALAALRELVRLGDSKSPELLERLEAAVRAGRSDSPSLEPVLARHRFVGARRPLDELQAVETWLDHDVGTVVEVVGKGVGRVVDLNLELENIKVDQGAGRPTSVPFGAVARYLRRLPPDDLRRRALEEPEAVQRLIEEEPGEALVQLLEGVGEPADVASLKSALDAFLPASKWTSWWAKARKHPRIVSSGSGSRLRYAVGGSADDATRTLLEELGAATPRNRLAVARRLATRGEEAAEATVARLAESLAELESVDPGLAWETAGAIVDLPAGRPPAQASRARLLESTPPIRLLSGIEDRGERESALQDLRAARNDWRELWAEWLLHEEHPAVLDLLAATLTEHHEDGLESVVEAVLRGHTAHPAQFVWLCEAMTADEPPGALRRRFTPSLLEKIPDALGRPEFSPVRGRAKALLDGGGAAIRLLLEQATPQQASRFAQRISRLSSVEPQRARLVEQAARQAHPPDSDPAAEAASLLVASSSAVERKRAELKKLVEEEIPKTLKGIQAAAAEGDLRENFEYHMLRDRQELQSARAAKLQRELGEVRILEPGTADTSRVNIGTVVRFAPVDGEAPEPVTILGVWDADVDRRIYANGSGVADALLGRTVGDEVELHGSRARIAGIDPWTG